MIKDLLNQKWLLALLFALVLAAVLLLVWT